MKRVLIACVAAVLTIGMFTAGCGGSPDSSTDGSTNGSEGGTGRDGERDGARGDSGNGAGTGSDQDGSGQGDGPDRGGPGDEDEPDLVGKGLAIAEQRAQDAGFEVRAYDSTGRNRTPVLGRSWQVCFQEPARSRNDEEIIRLGVVRTSEDCPDEDGSRNQPELGPDNELPDFTGASLQVATDALGSSASVDPVDARRDRNVFIPQNWRVCGQSPAPGTRWDGEPITFRVVKYGERCP